MTDQGCCLWRNVKKEFVRIVLERFQGEVMKGSMEASQPVSSDMDLPENETAASDLLEVEEMLNNPYMNRGEVPLAMDIFKPVVPEEEELPVVVMIHGGGLVMGDRSLSRRYGKAIASRGYLVFSVEYRLAPRANTFEQLDDICAGMDLIGRRLVDFNVDFTRMYLTAESAGAFLAVYVAAMKKSEKLQKAIGYEPTRMVFRALGLISGMYYTGRDDLIGCLLKDQFFGDKAVDSDFKQFLDPENPEILMNLPPAFMVTSRGDFLNNYTLMYHKAMKKAGKKSHLVYYGDNDIGHSFVTTNPDHPKSRDAIEKMLAWFKLQTGGKRL